MQASADFPPMTPDEVEDLSISFATYLQPNDTVTSIVGWNCSVAPQSLVPDPSPASHLSGSPALNGSVVTQTVQGLVAGVIYVMEAVVRTGLGETLSIWAFLECRSVG